MVLATGMFAIGTDAFVIGGVLPAAARSLGVSTSSVGLLVTAFAVAYALGAPILAVAGAPCPANTAGVGLGRVRRGQPARCGGAAEVACFRAKVGGGDTPASIRLRVTIVYRQVEGIWRLVHRHADPITSPQAAESVIGG
jgi:hypothetical protein